MFSKYFFVLLYLASNLSYKLTNNIGSKINHYSFLSVRKNKSIDFDQDAMITKKTTMKKMYKSSYLPKTENQKKYVECLNDDKTKMIVVTGPAGTGKTMFACLKAIDLLKKSDIDKIIITRPIITVEEEIGFLPGNIVKKMDPWTKPIFDLFSEYYSKMELDAMINKNTIEISPLGFMRGRTFKNAFIIADEMQNSSPNQMKMLTTRLGTNTRMVITGDLEQTDYSNNNSNYNGMMELINKTNFYYDNNYSEMSNKKMIQLVTLERGDIERSEIVKRMIDIYNYKPIEKTIVDKPIVESLTVDKSIERPKESLKERIINNNSSSSSSSVVVAVESNHIWDWIKSYNEWNNYEDIEELIKNKTIEEKKLDSIANKKDALGHYHNHSIERPKESVKERIINNDAALMPIQHLKSKNLKRF